ncbi:unnamed protein product [Phaedon cochleariae]|uniref:Ribosome-binding factor A, mitochondrial n=1 Tax=Phaedon cochleariae TaxID=80249 RepID=A0A9P0GVN3_PHACE|nr:unnamed protein product [Phaedon cochleariae]
MKMSLTFLRIYLSRSCFHTTCIENSSRQVGNAMRKILGTNKKKKFHYNDQAMVSPDGFTNGSMQKKPPNSRRTSVLNKLFMKHISDQMATGEFASEVLGHGIEINRVKIAPDFKILNVYWTSRTANDDKIDLILKQNAGVLRHELSQLRVMGNVPIISFVKDKQYAHMRDIDRRLAVADFGEDYVPVDPSTKFQVETEFFLSLEQDLRDKIGKLDAHQYDDDNNESSIPPMPQDTLGLDHAAIMDRIKKGMKKSEASHRFGNNDDIEKLENESWAKFKLNQPINNDPVSLSNNRSQRSEAFREFLLQRQLLKRRAKEKNYNPDLEYIKEELSASGLDDISRFEFGVIPDQDFIIEDDDEQEK